VDLQDLITTLKVGEPDIHLSIETTGADERRIENVPSVRGRNHDYLGVRVETIHLHKDRVKRLLPLVVPPAAAIFSAAFLLNPCA